MAFKRFHTLASIHKSIEGDIKLSLTLFLTLFGAIFLLVFGGLSLSNGRYLLSVILLVPLTAGLFNIMLLKTKWKWMASINLALICGLISLLLLAHGGKEETGILWTYTLVTIAMAILSVKQGLIFAASYLSLSAIIMYQPFYAELIVNYSSATTSRYLFSCLALCAMTLTLVNIQEKMTSELRKKTITDELTGLYNRGIIDNALSAIYSNRKTVPVTSLIMIDIDYFKRVNDDLGHVMGDKVLMDVAEILKACLRINDLAIRWGGEEFLLVLRNCHKKDAFEKTKLINQKLAKYNDTENELGRDITLSMGIAEVKSNDDLFESIKTADTFLYQAKDNGRNQVVWS